MTQVIMYTRPGCHLCQAVQQVILAARAHREFHFEAVNIESQPQLLSRYWDAIPVVAVNGREIARYRLTREDLDHALRLAGAESMPNSPITKSGN